MDVWKDEYLKAVKLLKDQNISSKGVLLGFNVNIDKIIRISPKIFAEIPIINEINNQLISKSQPNIINNIPDLLLCLFDAIEEGRADEVLISSKNVASWVEETFTISDILLGGQAGIMANLLTELNMKKILLSTPISSLDLINLLDDSIIDPTSEKDSRKIENVKIIENIEPLTHYIFEFSEGEYKIGDNIITCKRPNRFIASYDKVNSLLMFSDKFKSYSVEKISEYSLCIIAGFHLIDIELHSSFTYEEIIKSALNLISEWKKKNPSLVIHLELAAVKNEILKANIIENLFPVVDSIGMNEQELISYLQYIDTSMKISLKSNNCAIDLFKGLSAIYNKYPHLRLHLHFLDFFLILSSPISQELVVKRKTSLIISSLLTAVKAKFGSIKHNLNTILTEHTISRKGFEELNSIQKYLKTKWVCEGNLSDEGYIHTNFFTLSGVPSVVIDFPKYLVGLGDTISLIAVLFETQ